MSGVQLVSGMVSETVGQVGIDDFPDFVGAMPVGLDRAFRVDCRVDRPPEPATPVVAVEGHRRQAFAEQRIVGTVDIHIEPKRQEMVVVDRDEVGRDKRAIGGVHAS